ncbi:MAG: hypothetical protein B0W54_17585 [Cellvibrio sp. 79]|nr:MAG: hypothetical protein B0W54_17585 [Cellvibrio sp. 79]
MPEINPDFSLQVEHIGNEKNPLLIIDNVAAAPEQLRELATSAPGFIAQASDFYPGLRKPVTGNYPAACLAALEPVVRKQFDIPTHAKIELSLCAFSLTTTPPGQLRPIQSIPHIDTHDTNQFALVHYLCAPAFGGTSLYRHRSTGFESITQPRLQDYFRIVKQEVMAEDKREFTYINGSTALFERIIQVNARFNRAVIYRSNQLHSADINPHYNLSADPCHGRLTLNAFFRFTL